jgi:hypothetical protein
MCNSRLAGAPLLAKPLRIRVGSAITVPILPEASSEGGGHMRFGVLATCVAFWAGASAAVAQGTGITYDCDTPSGHFSDLVLPAPAGAFVVEGRVQLRQIAQIKDFLPITRLAISSQPPANGQPSADVAGFVLTALPESRLRKGAGKGLIQFVNWDERHGGSRVEHQPMGFMAAPQEQAFRIAYDGQTVAVRIGSHEQTLPFEGANPVIRIICSTGEFLYTNLTIMPGK